MHLTDYHAKYFTYELTKRCSSDNIEKLATSLLDAQVDLNPHQVEARLKQKITEENIFTIRWSVV